MDRRLFHVRPELVEGAVLPGQLLTPDTRIVLFTRERYNRRGDSRVTATGSEWWRFVDQRYDVIVLGAGPAGSTLAYQLARRGVKTLMVEREVFPRYKT